MLLKRGVSATLEEFLSTAKAALVAEAHGIMVEVHPEPEKTLSDGPQSLTFPGFAALMKDIDKLNLFLGF